jgi:predicted transcriptional regulator
MTPKLTPEQRQAIEKSEGPVAVEDDQTHRVYFLVDESTYTSLQQREDLAAIREGIADMEAGRVAPLDEVMARIRTNLGLV